MISQIILVIAATSSCLVTVATALPDQTCLAQPETTAGHAMLQVRQQRTELESDTIQVANVERKAVGALQQSMGLHACDGTNDIGESASLDESGYLAVKETCCNSDMYIYIKRVIVSMSMDVCEEGGVAGLLWSFTCDAKNFTGSFEKLTEVLEENNKPSKCFFLAQHGACEPWPAADAAECEARGEYDEKYWQKHPCSTTTTVEPTTTATEEPTATTTEAPETTTKAPTTTIKTTTASPTYSYIVDWNGGSSITPEKATNACPKYYEKLTSWSQCQEACSVMMKEGIKNRGPQWNQKGGVQDTMMLPGFQFKHSDELYDEKHPSGCHMYIGSGYPGAYPTGSGAGQAVLWNTHRVGSSNPSYRSICKKSDDA